ncbi:RexA-like intracellular sensor of abortive infection system [Vibrio crassostreae]|uniref:hypothetical protein n=1 Tax=Vibrio crassostreae TaxID=246167 RepID=UPI00104FD285|nr:hypothetical protein [Vibrio crassostreae]TCN64008.1 RexA-like intracellular sensor of abortive infection system [Vibrio crassostreae]
MKLRYFGYYLRKFDTQQKFLFNIKPIVDAFIGSNNTELKSSFKRGDEKLYLTQIKGHKNLYYFVRTSDDDIIKRINEQSITVGEISDKLSANEKVAFASHVYICPQNQIIAVASGMSCPRFDDFADYINELFHKVKLNNYQFHIDALTANASKQDLLKMKMVNSVYVDVAADKSLGKLIAKELTGSANTSLGDFRITIEPNGTNLKGAFKTMMNRLAPNGTASNTQGVTSIGAKAKHDELKGQLMDYWLDNENNLLDSLNKGAKTKLPAQITAKFDSNTDLGPLYKEYLKDEGLKAKADPLLDTYKDVKTFAKKEDKKIDTTKSANNDDGVVVPLTSEQATE